jgi:hypothetical protein
MNLKTLLDTPPWDWPTDAGRMFRKILVDQRADESDRLVAVELAGDFTVINDDLADSLLVVVRSADEPEQLRAKAAISLGLTFRDIQDSLQKIYLDKNTPKEVRRRILEASVRAPETWHQNAIGDAYSSGDEGSRL